MTNTEVLAAVVVAFGIGLATLYAVVRTVKTAWKR